jgi:hypothetical protein
MPILPDSLSSAPLPPPTGRRYYPHNTLSTLAEAPLMSRVARAGIEPTYPMPSRRAAVPEPAATRSEPRTEGVRLAPARFNTGASAAAAASGGGGIRIAPAALISSESDFLHPFGHLARARVPSVEATLAARGGIGVAKAGDKPYHRSEWSDNFASERAKPHKWHANPDGPGAKLTWTGAGAPSSGGVSGRPIWSRPS